jgi:type II secretory pathway component PulK
MVLAAALACLFLTVILGAGLSAAAINRHRQLVRQEQELQASWLAESAAQRAAARLQMDSEYTGETWSLPAGELGGRGAGQAVITVAAEDAGRRRVTIEAFYPDDPIERTRVVKERFVPVAGDEMQVD